MGLEHFAAGLGDGGHEPTTLLGVSKPVQLKQTKLEQAAQAKPLYLAEQTLRNETDTPLSQRLRSGSEAEDHLWHILMHPGLDEVPGIEDVRAVTRQRRGVTLHPEINLNGTTDHLKTSPTSIVGGITISAPHPLFPNLQRGDIVLSKAAGARVGTLSHELAHRILMNKDQFPDRILHQWPQARLHLHMVRSVFGNKYGAMLQELYDKHGVDYGNL